MIVTVENRIVPAVTLYLRSAEGAVMGRAWLYCISNCLHAAPYGLLEDLYVAPEYRSAGGGRALLEAVRAEACRRGCYKLIATSRWGNPAVHAWYERFGFTRHGIEFRLEL